jgi:DNA-binding NarL/FixJ family response regulator
LEANPLAAVMITSVLTKHNVSVEHYRSIAELIESLNGCFACAQIIVLDHGSFPQTNSETVRLLDDATGVPILLVDEMLPEADLCDFIHSGIKGFVSYSAVSEGLFPAICSIIQGQPWLDANVLRAYIHFVASLKKRNSRCMTSFTERQRQIAILLKDGLSNKEIAIHLNISESTVKFHIAKIFAKLDVHDRRSIMKDGANSKYAQMAEPIRSVNTTRAQSQHAVLSHLAKGKAG